MKGVEVRDMEAAALRNSSADHQQYSMYPPRMAARNPKTSSTTQTPPLIPQSSAHGGNLDFGKLPPQMEMVMNGGVFLNPPCPFPLSSYHEFRQPPLLPLPMPAFSSSPSSSAHFQSLPAGRGGGGRGIGFGSCRRGGSSASPTHKKMYKGSNKQPSKTKQYPDVKPDLGSAKRWISDPKSLPKHVTLTDVSTTTTSTFNSNMMEFCESVFAMAPPPSSLPMPKFSLKPKT